MNPLTRSPVHRLTRARVRQGARGVKLAVTGYGGWFLGRAGDLPSLLIIGAQRAGTTSLFSYLAQHPQVSPPANKELHFFSHHYERGTEWYRGNFPRLAAGEITLEATPLYLFDDRAPARIGADLPRARFIALLRNPATRAYSQYVHNRQHGIEPLSFVDALAAEPERIGLQDDGRVTGSRKMLHRYGYLARGAYAEQLRRWHDHVDPSSVLTLRSEDLYSHPEQTYARVLDFAGLPAFRGVAFEQRNHWDGGRSQLTPQLREELEEHFSAANDDLARLLGWTHTWGQPASHGSA